MKSLSTANLFLFIGLVLLMTLKPRFMILPGTESMAGYSDYRFHFRKFLNGIVFTLILSLIVTVIALGMELIH